MTKTRLKNLAALWAVSLALTTGCKKDRVEEPATPSSKETTIEGQFVRIFVSDQDLTNYYVVSPEKGIVETQAGQFANGSLHTCPGGQFVAVVCGTNNYVTFFDSGIEDHGEDAHVKYQPKWALTKSTAAKPVHFYGSGIHLVTFNDGEGSLSYFKETGLHTETAARIISVGVAHHGAPILFTNGHIAVTEKDGSVAGPLPERIKIVDLNGAILHASTIQTRGIHGDAGNGDLALFGSVDGILKVNAVGTQSLIKYPDSFGSNWLGSLQYGAKSKTFIGFKAKYGLYKIDPVANSVTVIEESANLFSATFDWPGQHLILLFTDGVVKVIDAQNLSTVVSKNLEVAFPPAGTKGNPTVAASESCVYFADAQTGKIKMYTKENLALVKEITLPGKPSRIALMGSLAREEHTH